MRNFIGLSAQLQTCRMRPVFIEKEANRNAKDLRNPLQPARTYAIDTFFVFLELLKGNPKRFRKANLAHAK